MHQQYDFRVSDWGKFQHYKKQAEDGKPARPASWIKNYNKLLGDPNYRKLSATQRALLHGLWLWWSSQDLMERWCGLDVEVMNRVLALTTKISTWTALSQAGFVELRASTSDLDFLLPDRAEQTQTQTR